MIPSAVFVPAAAPQTKFSLSTKFLRNLGSMPKTSLHMLCLGLPDGRYFIANLVEAGKKRYFENQCLKPVFRK